MYLNKTYRIRVEDLGLRAYDLGFRVWVFWLGGHSYYEALRLSTQGLRLGRWTSTPSTNPRPHTLHTQNPAPEMLHATQHTLRPKQHTKTFNRKSLNPKS